MALCRLWTLVIVAVFGLRSCLGNDTLASRAQDSGLLDLVKEAEDNSRYKTLEANATVLKLLVDDKNGVSKSEVFDMLHSRDEDEKHEDLPVFPEDAEDTRLEVPTVPDSQAEFLQSPGEAVRKDSQKLRYSAARGEPIMVAITCSIVCVAYTALVVWRRIYLKRNGLKHELLRNEENIAETRIEMYTRLPIILVHPSADSHSTHGERWYDAITVDDTHFEELAAKLRTFLEVHS